MLDLFTTAPSIKLWMLMLSCVFEGHFSCSLCFAWSPFQKHCFCLSETTLWDTSPDPGFPDYAESPADPVPEPALGPSLTTRAGGQDDVSLNKLPQMTKHDGKPMNK